ncbi:MAG TPA: plastocyanin/azurin family copper-binding protein [Gammaproteobacteria bacterium]|nr:plastocyanin/azurin family copper-binding protein [Gammaproteobacteria bacterium]
MQSVPFGSRLAIAVLLAVALTGVAQAKTVSIKGTPSLRFSVTHITARPGETLTVKLSNPTKMPASAMSHNWVLLKRGTDVGKFASEAMEAKSNGYIPPKMADDVIARTPLVRPGHTRSVTFHAPKQTGDYTYICSFPGHYAAGMKGTLTVK